MENLESKSQVRLNVEIVQFAAKKWKLLAIIGVIATIFAYVFSMPRFVPPKYKSEAVIYPVNLGEYSEENSVEQMQQYLESIDLQYYIVEKFNLYDEYEISQDDPNKKTWMNYVYKEHITFEKTRFESIKITVLSTDPVKARDIASEIISEVNHIIEETERKKYAESVTINKNMIVSYDAYIDSIQNAMKELSVKYGILDYTAQSEKVTEKYLAFLLSGKKGAEFEEVKTLFENLQKYGNRFEGYSLKQEYANEYYGELLFEYQESLKNLNKKITYSHVVVNPQIPDRKSSPIRWLIILSAVAASVGFTFVLLLILGYQKK